MRKKLHLRRLPEFLIRLCYKSNIKILPKVDGILFILTAHLALLQKKQRFWRCDCIFPTISTKTVKFKFYNSHQQKTKNFVQIWKQYWHVFIFWLLNTWMWFHLNCANLKNDFLLLIFIRWHISFSHENTHIMRQVKELIF